MSPKPTAGPVTLSADQVHLTPSGHPDYGTARVRLPVAVWTAAGIGYHRPVCCNIKQGDATWRVYCISALLSEDSAEWPGAVLDARVLLPPADKPSLTVPDLFAVLQAADRVTVHALTNPVTNARAIEVDFLEPIDVPASVLSVKLSQTLLVPGSVTRLAPGTGVVIKACHPSSTRGSGAAHTSLYRITPATQILTPDALLLTQQPSTPAAEPDLNARQLSFAAESNPGTPQAASHVTSQSRDLQGVTHSTSRSASGTSKSKGSGASSSKSSRGSGTGAGAGGATQGTSTPQGQPAARTETPTEQHLSTQGRGGRPGRSAAGAQITPSTSTVKAASSISDSVNERSVGSQGTSTDRHRNTRPASAVSRPNQPLTDSSKQSKASLFQLLGDMDDEDS